LLPYTEEKEQAVMSIELSESEESYIRQKVESGQYESVSRLLQEASHLLDVRDAELEADREAVRAGFEQIERGEFVYLDELNTSELLKRALDAARVRRDAEHSAVAS
jgi:putative addiction module CopG family antidote